MKMLKELKGKKVIIDWIDGLKLQVFRLEDYCEVRDEIWVKFRTLDNQKKMVWVRFSQVESIGRVP